MQDPRARREGLGLAGVSVGVQDLSGTPITAPGGAVVLVRGGILGHPAVTGGRGPAGRVRHRVPGAQDGAQEVLAVRGALWGHGSVTGSGHPPGCDIAGLAASRAELGRGRGSPCPGARLPAASPAPPRAGSRPGGRRGDPAGPGSRGCPRWRPWLRGGRVIAQPRPRGTPHSHPLEKPYRMWGLQAWQCPPRSFQQLEFPNPPVFHPKQLSQGIPCWR